MNTEKGLQTMTNQAAKRLLSSAMLALCLSVGVPFSVWGQSIQATPPEALADLLIMFTQVTDEKSLQKYVDSLHIPLELRDIAMQGINQPREAIAKAGGIKEVFLKRARPDTATTSTYIAMVVGNDDTAVNFLVSLTKIKSDWGVSDIEPLPPGIPEVFQAK